MADDFFPHFEEQYAAVPELAELYAAARANAGLAYADYLTSRDLLELSGYRDDPALHVLLLIMLAALDEGSLCVRCTAEALAQRLQDLTGLAAVGPWPLAIAAKLAGHAWPELIGDEAAVTLPVVERRLGADTFLYFRKSFEQERVLRLALGKRLQATDLAPLKADLPAILREVLRDQPLRLGGRPLELSDDQRLALAAVLLRRFTIISGGPGTGKTSLVRVLLRCLVRGGVGVGDIVLAAPTGRAAQRLTDSLTEGLRSLSQPVPVADQSLGQLQARTLHQVLGYRPDRGTFRHHAENPVSAQVVIVDEVSMVGIELLAQLVQSLRPETRLILLGDKDQLPSVEPGAVLANLTTAATGPVFSSPFLAEAERLLGKPSQPRPQGTGPLRDVFVVLGQGFRFAEEIQGLARQVNEGRLDLAGAAVPTVPAAEVTFAARTPACCRLDGVEQLDVWRNVLRCWGAYLLAGAGSGPALLELVRAAEASGAEAATPEAAAALGALFTWLSRGRILTLVREGPHGCLGVNRFLDEVLRPRLDPGRWGPLFAGAPVLLTRTDPARGLFNGDVGLALRFGDGLRVVFPRSAGYVAVPAEALPAHELAFATTVHKAQGSEFDDVLLVFPPRGARRLLTREMVYTGLTRARKRIVLAGPVEAIQTAISRRVNRDANLLA